MKFKWFKRQTARKREPVDIRALSKQIIAKRMKQDPEFGAEIAMRELKYEVAPEPEVGEYQGEYRPLNQTMKDARDLKKFMEELGAGGKGGGWMNTLAQGIGQGLGQSIGQALTPLAEKLAKAQAEQQGIHIDEEEAPRIPNQPNPKLPPRQLSIKELIPYLDAPPEEAFEELKVRYPAWLSTLKRQSPESIVEQLQPFRGQDPELDTAIDRLASPEGQEWLAKCIELAKKH